MLFVLYVLFVFECSSFSRVFISVFARVVVVMFIFFGCYFIFGCCKFCFVCVLNFDEVVVVIYDVIVCVVLFRMFCECDDWDIGGL